MDETSDGPAAWEAVKAWVLADATTEENDAALRTLIALAEKQIRADERARVADDLRATVRNQDSWLWFELGETALGKVAAYIDPSRDTP